ncbi:hypothetical protein EI94DRAFT_1735321 [Lactarius quietus]|nr:hypothetical protein EI94DRAFT_1735321 [Lactarius quietus]
MSFLSVEPQSRAVLEKYSNILLAQFDYHLGIITDRYLAFFQERRTIEATYIDSLRRLHLKAKIVDASPDAEPTTTKAAWDKVTDDLERKANTHQEFVDILDNEVIKPFATFKEMKADARKRIEEDLKNSSAAYADHAENRISELQETYFEKYYSRFRSRENDSGAPERPRFQRVSDNDFRSAIVLLNDLRVQRVEYLVDGYDCLEELVFAPITKNIIVKYMNGMTAASAKYDNLARSTRLEVEQAIAGRDTLESDLRASFRRALSFSIPPPTFYRNYSPVVPSSGAHSDLIFGVPLVDVETDEDNVPKVMRMCIDEVEKCNLNTKGIYSEWYSFGASAEVLQLGLESENFISFRTTDDIYSIGEPLKLYLGDLPEPLFSLCLQDYRNYRQIRAEYIENDCSLLRSKIHELHPVHKASLGALLRHLSLVASHSDENEMSVEMLAAEFTYHVLRGNKVLQDGVDMKALVMEDLIRNVHTLFDERPSMPLPAPLPHAAETASPVHPGSLLSGELQQPSEADEMRHCPGPVSVIPTSTQSLFSSLPSDVALESRFTPSLPALSSHPPGRPSSHTVVERAETASKEQVTPETRDTAASLNSPPPEVVAVLVAEWRLRQSHLPPQPDAVTVPQNPPESLLSTASDSPLSSVMSL